MVHSMTPKAGLLCMVAAWLTRVPVRVHTFTGLVWPTATGLKRRILKATDRLTCACATHIIPEGEGVKHDLQTGGISRKPMRVLGYGNVRGIDMVRFSMRKEIAVMADSIRKDGIFTFIFVGRIVGDKGINELVAAFQQLNAEIPLTRLLLVGYYETELDPVSEATRDTIKQNSNIEVMGERWDDELVACYAAADCFVLPSYREGFPNTVLEAGAMGLPSIVTDINGSREIIEDGVNGIIIPPRDERALYQAMIRTATDTDYTVRMASIARKRIANRYEQSYVRQCLYDFYDEILKINV